MSLLSELKNYPGSKKTGKRWGRGKGSGKGGTSTKGHKGQKARKSGNIPAGFEGGSMPLARRLPKFGFTNARFKKTYEIVNLSQLEKWKEDVTPEALVKKGVITYGKNVKVLAKGDLKTSLKVQAHKFSKKAKEMIEKAGGQVEVLQLKQVDENVKSKKSKTSSKAKQTDKDSETQS